ERGRTVSQEVFRRVTFETSRAGEYFGAGTLQSMTGQPRQRFPAVALKELLDNALDAAEQAGLPPQVRIGVREAGRWVRLTVADNGGGIPPEVVTSLLNFHTFTSDKSAYRSPTRGAQGNALKTVIGIPHALGSRRPVVIEARGVRHTISASVDP